MLSEVKDKIIHRKIASFQISLAPSYFLLDLDCLSDFNQAACLSICAETELGTEEVESVRLQISSSLEIDIEAISESGVCNHKYSIKTEKIT